MPAHLCDIDTLFVLFSNGTILKVDTTTNPSRAVAEWPCNNFQGFQTTVSWHINVLKGGGWVLGDAPLLDVMRKVFRLYRLNNAKFGQLILSKIVNIVATICQILRQNFEFAALPTILAGFKGPPSKGKV